ncbi:MAG: DUF4384 domain-containing protein [Bacteroidia bacterium]|nr:DUF4384 domain-containing protein [Bacteroidia bacterium]
MRILWGLACGIAGLLWSQERMVSGFAEVELLPGWSIERAQRQAQQLAILQALQSTFPNHIAQASKYLIDNRTEGRQARTQTYFYLTADQYIGGEWLQTTDVRFSTEVRKGQVWVTCKIRGRARPRLNPPLPLELRTLRCRDTACTTTDFLSGDPFYLSFRSVVPGYLQVFWEDSGRVYRLLPYQNQRQNAWPVRGDTTYLFFSSEPQHRSEAFWTDELLLTAEKPEVLHRIYVLFSQHPLSAPPERFDPTVGFHVVDFDSFQEWLLAERLRLSDLNVRYIDISVRQR